MFSIQRAAVGVASVAARLLRYLPATAAQSTNAANSSTGIIPTTPDRSASLKELLPGQNRLRAVISFAISFIASLALCVPASAADGVALHVGSINLYPNQVHQGQSGYRIGFTFELAADKGFAIEQGQVFEVDTNIGELFSAKWDDESLSKILVTGSQGEELLSVAFSRDQITFTVLAGADGSNSIKANVRTPVVLQANDVGATESSPLDKTIQIESATATITFLDASSTPGNTNIPGAVDIDTFWKNGYTTNDGSGADITMEVNPIGSLDLYESTTFPGPGERVPKSYEKLMVEDQIPDNGFIDTASIKIYTSIPTLIKSEADYLDKWHGNYSVPKGTYYAQRNGTIRDDLIDLKLITRLEQQSGESFDDFKQRIYDNNLTWGIYCADNTETFLCNFGNVGSKTNNNGLLYKDFSGRGKEYAEKYPDIFGDNGATGGNIVSYYIQFRTYYPDIVGPEKVINSAKLTAEGQPVGGNQAEYTIGIGGGTGIARKNELVVRVVDADNIDSETGQMQPIEGAVVKVQRKDGDKWVDIPNFQGQTGSNGRLVFGTFSPGTYRVVQTGWAEGYIVGAYEFSATGNDAVNSVNNLGEFIVEGTEAFGFGAVIENKHVVEIALTPQDIVAYTGGDSISGSCFPAVRYAVTGVDSETLKTLSFEYDGNPVVVGPAGSYWTFTGLPVSYTLEDAETAADDDDIAGIYAIGIDASKLKVVNRGGDVDGRYDVSVVTENGDPATVIVRNVSSPDEVVDVTRAAVNSKEEVDTSDGIGAALIPEEAQFYTNGSNKNLGLIGGENGEEPQVSLLFDDLLAGTEDATAEELLIERANSDENLKLKLTSENTEFKYLDLVNEDDGNAWVSCDRPVTVYWPIPEGVEAKEDSFKVYHFTGLHREYRGELEQQIEGCVISPVKCTVEGDNVMFTLDAAPEGGCFSPFALAWEPADPSDPEDPTNEITVTKTLENGRLLGDDFQFVLELEDGPEGGVSKTQLAGTNDANGSVSFEDGLVFSKSGTYTFRLSEALPKDDDSLTDGVQSDGVTYDENGYILLAEVEQDGDGKLAVTWSLKDGDKTEIEFVNIAEREPDPGPNPKPPVDDPDEPGKPDPDEPDAPDEPDTPEPDDPDEPDEPDTPDEPDEPDIPDTPEPDEPDTLDIPEPTKPSTPEPTKPTKPSNPEATIPQTGDALTIAAALSALAGTGVIGAGVAARRRRE